jgi:flagellar biogenesis protein FliO
MIAVQQALRGLKKRKVLVAVGAVCVVVFLGLVWIGSPSADETTSGTDDAEAVPLATINAGGMVFRIIGSVALVVGVLYAGMYAMKVLSRRAGGGNLKKDAICVLQRKYIAPKKAIYVVTVGNRAMVVGVTDTQISHLADLTEDEIESIKATEPQKPRQFRDHLLAFGLGMRNKP